MAPLLVTKIAVLALSMTWPALAVNRELVRREQPKFGLDEASPAALFEMASQGTNTPDAGVSDWCDDDYPLGQPNSNCADSATEVTLSKQECIEAMNEARASYKNNKTEKFEIGFPFYHNYPKGCFAKTEDSGCEPYGVCYYYNECEGDQCTGVTHNGTLITEGTPVCKRVKIEHGTADTSGGCPAGYDNIKDETTCAVLAACLSDCQGGTNAVSGGTQFRINIVNATKYHDHPKWCFINPSDKCAYFNTPLVAAAGASVPDPTNPVGTPLCNVTTITDYSGSTSQSIQASPMTAETYQAHADMVAAATPAPAAAAGN